MKKHTTKNVSITHESKKTIVIVDGEEIDLDGSIDHNHLLEMLNNSGLDSQLISEFLSASGTNQLQNSQTSNKANINSLEKVECSGCNRTVSYGKGICMYCGQKLTLTEESSTNSTSNSVDKKYLDTDTIETGKASTDKSYIDRLKDI